MPTTREVLDATIELEKQSMALYARFAKIFASEPALQDFWFGMARDEARHVGALDLVTTVLDQEEMLDKPSPISLEDATIVRLRALLQKAQADAKPGIKLERALEIALEVEETELEDLVSDLLKALQAPDEYERCLRLLIHDLGELGLHDRAPLGQPGAALAMRRAGESTRRDAAPHVNQIASRRSHRADAVARAMAVGYISGLR